MKSGRIRAAIACGATLLAGAASAQNTVTIVHAGWLLDVPGKAPKTRQSIVIENGKINAVHAGFIAPVQLERKDATVDVVDLEHSYVTPGLIDSHVHLTFDYGQRRRLDRVEREDSDLALRAAGAARLTLEAGFTTVRDVGAHGHSIFALRDAVSAGTVPGPRIVAAGAIISITGGHGDDGQYRHDVLAAFEDENGVCDSVDECRKMVRKQAKRGADVIKFTATGGVMSVTDRGVEQQFTNEEMAAIVSAAHSLGRKVAAHAHDKAGIDAALRAGVDSIEHGTFATNSSFEQLRKSGAYIVPTQMTIGVAEHVANDPSTPAVVRSKAREMLPHMRAGLPRMVKAGVRLAFGTDAGTFPHGQNAQEFRYLAAAGISSMDAIVMATVNAADLLGMSDTIGTLEPGKAADLIAVTGDPLADTRAFEHPVFVMRAGIVYKDMLHAAGK